MARQMMPTQAWQRFVGEQTPAQFVEDRRDKGFTSVEDMVYEHIVSLHLEGMHGRLMDELIDLLSQHIRTEVPDA